MGNFTQIVEKNAFEILKTLRNYSKIMYMMRKNWLCYTQPMCNTEVYFFAIEFHKRECVLASF